MTHDGELIELRVAEGLRLRTSFTWRADRYAHTVTLIESNREQTLLESIEGEPDDPWPPSPAFQQLSMQGEGDQRVALLVGMAGKSHWSMSVEASVVRKGFVFDVACRLSNPTDAVGSGYLARGHALIDSRTLTLPVSGRQVSLVLDPLPADEQSLSVSADQFRVGCPVPPSTAAQTVRWKYAVTLCADGAT